MASCFIPLKKKSERLTCNEICNYGGVSDQGRRPGGKTASGFAYPDSSIVCHGARPLEGLRDIVPNQTVIIEILSPETYDYDHGKKVMLYRQTPSLKEYILIFSTEVLVEKFIRNETASWTLTEYQRKEDAFTISAIDDQTTAEAVYREAVFDTVPGQS